jgi:hypothetical protein
MWQILAMAIFGLPRLTIIGMKVMYGLTIVLRRWLHSLLRAGRYGHTRRNGKFLNKLIEDVKIAKNNFMTSIELGTLKDFNLPCRLVYAFFFMNVNTREEGQTYQACLVCNFPIEENRRTARIPMDVELKYTDTTWLLDAHEPFTLPWIWR